MPHPVTAIYVDTFNLYYGVLRKSPYKWLNIRSMCEALLPTNDIQFIRCFTARVTARPHDPNQPDRQNAYLRALATVPGLSIHLGRFQEKRVSMHLVNPPPGGPYCAIVHKTEEKGSDVNLAAYLLMDGFKGLYDVAVVVSNDSDLVEPIRMVRKELGKPVLVLHPCLAGSREIKRGVEMRKACTKSIPGISPAILAASQFPSVLTDANGTITKPASW
jgi:uncharacterized LabA/DUF88 family protein